MMSMLRTLYAVLLAALLLTACGQSNQAMDQATATRPQADTATVPRTSLGIFSIRFQDSGGAVTPFSTSTLSSQGLIDVNPNLTMEVVSVDTFTVQRTRRRYINTTYRVKNMTPVPLKNLTLLPIDTDGIASAGPTIGTTALKDIRLFNNDPAPASVAGQITLQSAVRYDRATDDAVTDTSINTFQTGFDVSGLHPAPPPQLTVVSVQPNGWRTAGSLAPGDSTLITFTASFPMAANAKEDPFNFVLMVAAAVEAVEPANTVNVIYLQPTDKALHPEYSAALSQAFQHIQLWYADQNSGKTFKRGQLLTVTGSLSSSAYATAPVNGINRKDQLNEVNGNNQFYLNALNDALSRAGVPSTDPNIWLVYVDADLPCDQTAGALASGRGVLTANDLRAMSGFRVEPLMNNCPADPEQPPIRTVMQSLGRSARILAQAIGVPIIENCAVGDDCNRNLMGLGFLTYPVAILDVTALDIVNSSPSIGDIAITLPDHNLTVRSYNQDDLGNIYLNGQLMISTGYGFDSGYVNLSPWLKADGPNVIRLTNENGIYGGYTYGFNVAYDGETLVDISCGTAGLSGCDNNASPPPGITFDRTITLP